MRKVELQLLKNVQVTAKMKSLTQTKILVLDKQVSAGLSSFKMSDVQAAVTFQGRNQLCCQTEE